MENIDSKHTDPGQEIPIPIETDYESHKENPGPAEPAVNEKDENGAGKAMKWILPIIVIALLIWWFLIKK